ncbi:MAG: 30S ribosomal protein S4 [Patescibacteria group bacterium]
MIDAKCKKCIRVNEKLFLKGDKCYSPKCSFARKSTKSFSRRKNIKHPKRGFSEYGLQMREKQKVKLNYGINERHLINYVKTAGKKKNEDIKEKLYQALEMRLDNAVFKSGLMESKSRARQAVSHGHFLVNNKKVDIPSLGLKAGDKFSIRPQSMAKGIFKDLEIKIKKYNPPAWIKLDKEKKAGEIAGRPSLVEEPVMQKSLNAIVEFYNR